MVGLVPVSLLVLTWPVLPGPAIPVWCDERSEEHPHIGYTGMCPVWVEGNALAGSKGSALCGGAGGYTPHVGPGASRRPDVGAERSEAFRLGGTRERAKRANAKLSRRRV